MRIIAVLPDERQVSTLTDSLKNMGLDRKDMIISSLSDDQKFDNVEEATEAGISMIKNERGGLNDMGAFFEGIKNIKSDRGIVVAVKASKHETTRVKEIMEQSGATEIIQE